MKRIFSGSIYYCALTCGSFVLERCSAVWRLGVGGFLVVALVVVLVNCIYFRGTFLKLLGMGGRLCVSLVTFGWKTMCPVSK